MDKSDLKLHKNKIIGETHDIKSRNENNLNLILTSQNHSKNLNSKNSLLFKRKHFSKFSLKSQSNPNIQNYTKSSLSTFRGNDSNLSKGLLIKDYNNKSNFEKYYEEKMPIEYSFSNDDLLIVVGNKNNKFQKRINSNPYLNYAKKLYENENNSKKYDNNSDNIPPNKTIKEKKNKIKEDTSFKPVKIADTIYKELCKKKNYFINKLKEKKNKLSGYIIDSRNQKTLNKSNSEGGKNLMFTNYLDRKVYKNIPITFPIYLSFKNEYESQSEKNRQEKIVEKFIQLKTHIHNQPENENLYLKEFLCKNGFDEPENHTPRKLINLSYFLNHPFNFDSKKRIKDIIKDALNYKPTNDELISDQNKLKAINYFTNGENNKKNFISYSPQFYKKINAFPKTSIYKKENIFDSIDQEKFNNYLSLQKEKSHQSLSEIIINLEDEFTKMKNEKILVSDRTKINHEILKQKQNEENKLIPNLCLSYKGFSNLYLKRKKKENNKISNMIKKEEKINNINDRLYYSFKRKSEDMDKIRRRQKLTEYIFLERAKYKVLIDSKKKKIKNMPIID